MEVLLNRSPDKAAAQKAADLAVASLDTFKSADVAYFATGILDALKNANLPFGAVPASKLDALVADLAKLKVRGSIPGRCPVSQVGIHGRFCRSLLVLLCMSLPGVQVCTMHLVHILVYVISCGHLCDVIYGIGVYMRAPSITCK